ncbi:MAG TPA: DUF29 family protein [Acetobacteraceae bacterium]|jgi:hypothetical protein|nr:DUF29 family protein [Acetobacteraceae bacterium]
MGSMYDQDLVLWSEQQARALRAAADAGWDASIDWENVAAEIESVGTEDRRALVGYIAIVIEHLLKLQASRSPIFGRGLKENFSERGAKSKCWWRRAPAYGAGSLG